MRLTHGVVGPRERERTARVGAKPPKVEREPARLHAPPDGVRRNGEAGAEDVAWLGPSRGR